MNGPAPSTSHPEAGKPIEVPKDVEHIMVLSTAQRHGRGVQRLPDRIDRGRRVAAIQVETNEQAAAVLSALDSEDRTFYLDVERKRDLHLMRVAQDVLHRGRVAQIKPNDLTVDALQALLVHHLSPDLSDLRVTVYGTGNLAFKFALRLCESGAAVNLQGRNHRKIAQLAEAINAVAPQHTPHRVTYQDHKATARVLISAVTAEHVIDDAWVDILEPGALCVDVGISNFSPAFIQRALAQGHNCLRLDVRSAGDPLPLAPNPFFNEIAGRRSVEGGTIVAGGLMGERGEVVVDEVLAPSFVVGVANGTGGLLKRHEWPEDVAKRVEKVRGAIDFASSLRSGAP